MNETSFKDNMLEWNELKESAKKFADGQKKIKDRIKELNDQNIKYMETEGVDEVNVDNFEITLRRTVRKVVDVKRSNPNGRPSVIRESGNSSPVASL